MKQSFLIQDYIKLETNSIFELSIESLNLYEVDKEISNYSLDMKNKYKKVLTNILDILISKEEILFDVEIIFMFPWAVNFKILGWFGFIEMILFIILLAIGFLYAWKKGALEWHSIK